MPTPNDRAWNILHNAELVCSAERIEQAFVTLGEHISTAYHERFPLVIAVMIGALYFAGQLLPRLRFPLTVEYVHATRYGAETAGGQLQWKVKPAESVRGRDVLLLDDILDAGQTLAAIHAEVLARGAASCAIAVLADKQHGRPKPIEAQYVGVDIPDRFVFGCGLDVSGYWRNLPAIYAVKGT